MALSHYNWVNEIQDNFRPGMVNKRLEVYKTFPATFHTSKKQGFNSVCTILYMLQPTAAYTVNYLYAKRA